MDVTLYMVSKEKFGRVSKLKTIKVPSIVPAYDGTTVQLQFKFLSNKVSKPQECISIILHNFSQSSLSADVSHIQLITFI